MQIRTFKDFQEKSRDNYKQNHPSFCAKKQFFERTRERNTDRNPDGTPRENHLRKKAQAKKNKVFIKLQKEITLPLRRLPKTGTLELQRNY